MTYPTLPAHLCILDVERSEDTIADVTTELAEASEVLEAAGFVERRKGPARADDRGRGCGRVPGSRHVEDVDVSALKVGDTATVVVDGKVFTGTIYHVRENGWPCIETSTGHVASGPVA